MRAVVLREFGPPAELVVDRLPDPEPGPGQALVEVELASVTFVETQVRAGRPPHPSMAPALPVVPGNGVGGRVAAVGDGVDPGVVGRRVVTTTGGTGGYAERAVVAAASGARKGELALRLGAERAVDYTKAGWAPRAGEVDVVFDGVGGALAAAAFDLVSLGGRFCGFGMASGSFSPITRAVADDFGVTLVRGPRLTPERQRTLSERALALAAAGRLRPVVGQTFALDRAGDAHAAIESRATIGKTLLAT